MTHVASLKFRGGGSLEILYNVMQRPAGHELIALASAITQREWDISVRWSRTSFLLTFNVT